MASTNLPIWVEFVTGLLLLTGSAFALIGSLGLLRLRTFYERLHAPTLGASFGTIFILLASMIYFSVVESRHVLHELLIAAFTLVTTPITFMILVRAALFRDRSENTDRVPSVEVSSDSGPLRP